VVEGNLMRRAVGLLAVLLFLALGASSGTTYASERVALVIGNSKYTIARPLSNARRDAEAVSDKLRFLGFDVVELFDADGRATLRALNSFKAKSAGADLLLIYFAGHGLQLFGENFLLASDFDPDRLGSRSDLGLQLSALVAEIRQSSNKRLIVLIDACRDNPLGADAEAKLLLNGARVLGRSASLPQKLRQGLAPVEASTEFEGGRDAGESLFMFSAQPGRVALDGNGQNSPFAEALLVEMSRSELDVVGVFTEVARYVVEMTKGFQRPELRMTWTTAGYRLSPVGQARRTVRYDMSEAKSGDALYDSNIDKLMEFYRPEYLHGPFNAAAALLENISQDNWRYKARVDRSKFDPQKAGLGYLRGFEFDLDLDGDGVNEGLYVRSGQVGVEFYIRKAGVLHRFEPVCPRHDMDADQGKSSPWIGDVEAVEVAVLDINNNRKADIWVFIHRKDSTWPDLCVLETTGKYKQVDTIGWGTVSTMFDPFVVEPLISNTGGWGVNILSDRTIEICAGSYCANRWTYKWKGTTFEQRRDGDLVKEFVRVGWPAEVLAEWSKDTATPALTAPEVANELSDPSRVIRTYLVTEYLKDREQFADYVDYYDNGVVSREFALADKANYAARWPTRQYELIENSIVVSRQSQDPTTTSFRYRYTVSRPGKTSSGTGATQLALRKVGSKWLVESVKEVIAKN
jgi:hypothetical protein